MEALRGALKRFLKKFRILLRRADGFFWRCKKTFLRANRRGKAVMLGCAALLLAGVVTAVVLLCRPKAASAEPLTVQTASARTADSVQVMIAAPATPEPMPTPTPTPDPTLKRGMESEAVQQLQERLMELGFLDLDESTLLFGPATEAAVEQFQRQVNFTETLGVQLTEDGIAGLQTLTLLYSGDAPKYVAKEGMSGDDITNMQIQLKDLGYMSATTGYYGEKTIAAIKEFQGRNGLSADGLAGTKTYEMLYSDSAKESASKAHEARTKANISKMIEVAKSKLGCTYVLGSTGPSKFDCSGLVYYCLKEAGSNRRRLNAAGYSNVSDWEKITKMSSLKKGDLIFFYNNAFSKVGHVGIVVGSGMMIDASSANGKVVRRSFQTSYWQKHFVCGRRPW